ncbi:hypothetical protein [Brevibacillus sp. HD3.3A]|uniref:hypothetical protein n=1 Tax=Brevibacillus sp. HD3.3A TaxID=2738979 RepID=UPI00156AACEF|nr:hypothetical protein [Brevibacillus sp. HD3.3A]UED70712.1 hypothetical protein HP435_08775 [Brevibacillus sp. HD3.3A]
MMNHSGDWRNALHEMILYGMLFKAVARDADSLDLIELKLSYRPILDAVSQWAERKHHEYRRQFTRSGGKLHSQKLVDGFRYDVLVTHRGYQYKDYYNIEILKAECQVRLERFLQSITTKNPPSG